MWVIVILILIVVHHPCQIGTDRKSTRLNSSHLVISYAVFCLKKKDKQASHFVPLPGLSYSGVQSPTDCQQSLFAAHFAARPSLSVCPVASWHALFDALIRRHP